MRTLAPILFALSSLLSLPAQAQVAAPASAPSRAPLIVRVDAGSSGLSADVIRTAIAKELGVEAVAEGEASSSVGVRILGNRARVSFTRASGEKLEREVELPVETSSRIEVIALLAGNLARDEASELLAGLKKPESEPEPEPEPVAAVEPTPTPAPALGVEAKTTPAPASAEGARRGPLAANLSLFHPLAIVDGSERQTFDIEVGLAYSRIGGLTGFGLTVGHLRVEGPAHGVGISGLWTRVDGDARGAFGTGILSQGGGTLEGAEASGIATLRRGDVDGAQGAGIVSTAARVRGAQLSGAVSWANGPVIGFQAAGALAYAKHDVDGVQLSVLNIGGNVHGAQLGLVNIGGNVKGSQVGLVNVSDRVEGVPLGLVNVVKNGRTQAVAWADTQVVANAAVKYLNGPVYTLVGAGYDGGDGAAPTFAIGAHVKLSRATYLEIDALYRYLTDFDDTDSDPDRHLSALRGLIGIEGLGPTGVFVGGGVSHDVDSHGEGSRVRAYGVAGVSLF